MISPSAYSFDEFVHYLLRRLRFWGPSVPRARRRRVPLFFFESLVLFPHTYAATLVVSSALPTVIAIAASPNHEAALVRLYPGFLRRRCGVGVLCSHPGQCPLKEEISRRVISIDPFAVASRVRWSTSESERRSEGSAQVTAFLE